MAGVHAPERSRRSAGAGRPRLAERGSKAGSRAHSASRVMLLGRLSIPPPRRRTACKNTAGQRRSAVGEEKAPAAWGGLAAITVGGRRTRLAAGLAIGTAQRTATLHRPPSVAGSVPALTRRLGPRPLQRPNRAESRRGSDGRWRRSRRRGPRTARTEPRPFFAPSPSRRRRRGAVREPELHPDPERVHQELEIAIGASTGPTEPVETLQEDGHVAIVVEILRKGGLHDSARRSSPCRAMGGELRPDGTVDVGVDPDALTSHGVLGLPQRRRTVRGLTWVFPRLQASAAGTSVNRALFDRCPENRR
jgi:hypothetical protein